MNDIKQYAKLNPNIIESGLNNKSKIKNGEIKQKCIEMWLWTVCNIITYGIGMAFLILYLYFDKNWKEALGFTATYLVEYFIIQHFNKKQQ